MEYETNKIEELFGGAVTKTSAEGPIFPYIAYEPKDCRQKKLPLIIQLHGGGEKGGGGRELYKVEAHGFSRFFSQKERPCILVMPQCPVADTWSARVESLCAFVAEMTKLYGADPNRVYLTGLSIGGFGTWLTAMAKPSLFAAIAPVCGGGRGGNFRILDMPVWAFHGTADPVINVFYSDDLVKNLEKMGKQVRYTRLEGVEHNAWDYTYGEELYEWLLEKSR